jgi:hypothetical protein
LRKRALLCAGNFPEPTGPTLKAEGKDHGSRNATRAENRPASSRVLGRNGGCVNEGPHLRASKTVIPGRRGSDKPRISRFRACAWRRIPE